jgi:hypothetical protein
MKLPDGTILMDGDLAHRAPYDPAKARAYYLRTRKLKGRKKGAAKPPPAAANQKKYRAALDKFLAKLPMAQEGASLKDTEAFVDRMRQMTDAEMKAEAAKIKKEKGNFDGAQVATIEALLANRNMVRSKKADAKKVAAKPKSTPVAKAVAKKNTHSKAALAAFKKSG